MQSLADLGIRPHNLAFISRTEENLQRAVKRYADTNASGGLLVIGESKGLLHKGPGGSRR